MSESIDSTKTTIGLASKIMVMNLKNQLKTYLDYRGISAAELSRKSGVSKQVLSLWSGGAKPKNIEQVKKVADCLGVTLDYLLFGEGVDQTSERVTELDALLGDEWLTGQFEIKIRRIKKGRGQR